LSESLRQDDGRTRRWLRSPRLSGACSMTIMRLPRRPAEMTALTEPGCDTIQSGILLGRRSGLVASQVLLGTPLRFPQMRKEKKNEKKKEKENSEGENNREKNKKTCSRFLPLPTSFLAKKTKKSINLFFLLPSFLHLNYGTTVLLRV